MATSITLDIDGNWEDVLKALQTNFKDLNVMIGETGEAGKKSFKGIGEAMNALDFVAVTQAIRNVKDAFTGLTLPGVEFESSLAMLSVRTGIVGEDLEKLGRLARDTAKAFGMDASESVEVYQGLITHLGKEVAEQPDILEDMADGVSRLSMIMGGDTKEALNLLTDSMARYGISMDDPIQGQKEVNRLLNVLAASAEGNNSLSKIGESLTLVGGDAFRAGISIEELTSTLHVLDKDANNTGVRGARKLREIINVMDQMELDQKHTALFEELGINIEKVSDKTIPYSERLKEIAPLTQDTAVMAEIFGKTNTDVAYALINNTEKIRENADAVTDTNALLEKSGIIAETTADKTAGLSQWIDDLKISFHNTLGGITPYLSSLADLSITTASLYPLYSSLIGVIKSTTAYTKIMNLVTKTTISIKKTVTIATKAWGVALTNVITKIKSTTAYTKAMNIVTKATAPIMRVVTTATKAWSAAFAANPIGAVILAVTTLIAVIGSLSSAFKSNRTTLDELNDIQKDAIVNTVDQRTEVSLLFDELKRLTPGTSEYHEVLGKIEKIQPGITKQYNLQAGALEDMVAAQTAMNDALIKNARIQATQDKREQLAKEIVELQDGLEKEKSKNLSKSESALRNFWTLGIYDTVSDYEEKIAQKTQTMTDLLGDLEKTQNEDSEQNSSPQSQTDYTGASFIKKLQSEAAEAKSNEEESAYQRYLRKLAIGNDDNSGTTTSSSTGTSGSSSGFSSAAKKEINTRIESVVKNLNINVPDISMSPAKIQDIVAEALIGAIRDSEVALG